MNAARSTDKMRITSPKPILPAYITPTPGKKKLRTRAKNGLFSPVTGLPQDVVSMFCVDASNSVIVLFNESRRINAVWNWRCGGFCELSVEILWCS